MKTLILLLGAALAASAQGTVPTTGTWTQVSMHGAPIQLIGYEGTEYVSSLKAHCAYASYHTLIGAGENDLALVCYSYRENRTFVLTYAAGSHDEHNSVRGHPVGIIMHVPEMDSLFWASDESGSLDAEPFLGHWWGFDIAGLTARDYAAWAPWSTAASAQSPFAANTTQCGKYDPVNKVGLLYPNHLNHGGLWNPATNTWTQASATNEPNVPYWPTCEYNRGNGLFYVFGGGAVYNTGNNNLWSYNAATDTWTAITPASCTGADCTGGKPPARYNAFFACSSVDSICLMGGGKTGSTPLYDTWKYDYVANTWTELSPPSNYAVSGQISFNNCRYDPDSNVFVLWMQSAQGGSGSYADGTSTGVNMFVFPYSTALGYGRTVNTYTPAHANTTTKPGAVALNVTAPTATSNSALGSQSYAIQPSIAADASGNLYAAWGETSNYFDYTNCSGLMSTYVKKNANTGSGLWSIQGSGCGALRTLGMSNVFAGYHPKITVASNTPWVLHDEFDNSGSHFQWIFAYRWTGSAWSGAQVGCFAHTCDGNISSQTAKQVIEYQGKPTVALLEYDRYIWGLTGGSVPAVPDISYLWVAQYNGSSWVALGGPLNVATTPGSPTAGSVSFGSKVLGASITTDGTNLYACFNESFNTQRYAITTSAQVYCRMWNGSSWSAPLGGGSRNFSATSWAGRPGAAYANGTLHVAWTERTVAGNPMLYTGRYDGSTWTVDARTWNRYDTGIAVGPRLASNGKQVWMAWEEQEAVGKYSRGYVARWNGLTWQREGDAIVADPVGGSIENIDLVIAKNRPVVIFSEMTLGNLRQIYAKQWTGAAWLDAMGTPYVNGLGASTVTCVDKDGDGYGTGAGCTGPDADDDDATVQTAAHAIAAYGGIHETYRRRGYRPQRYWLIDPVSGNNTTAAAVPQPYTPAAFDACTAAGTCAPYLTNTFQASILPGDAVVIRGASLTAAWTFYPIKEGAANLPVYYLAYPGEVVTFSVSGAKWNYSDKSWFVLDGFKFPGTCIESIGTDNSGTPDPTSSKAHDIILRHLEGYGCNRGLFAMVGIENFLVEESSFHDQVGGTHGIYVGTRGILISKNITIRRNLLYNNPYTGAQQNGRCYNCEMSQNIAYGNTVSGLSWENGPYNSRMIGNVLFDNAKQINMSTYDGTEGTVACGPIVGGNRTQVCTCNPVNQNAICAFSIHDNIVENNTLWDSTSGSQSPLVWMGRQNNVGIIKCSTAWCLGTSQYGNTFRNNIFGMANASTRYYPPFVYTFYETMALPTGSFTSTMDGVLHYEATHGYTGLLGWGNYAGGGFPPYTCSTASSGATSPPYLLGSTLNCWNVDPQFTALGSKTLPQNYDFRLQATSPAIGRGSTGYALYDAIGNAYEVTPTMGAYAFPGPVVSISPPSLPNGTAGTTYPAQTLTANNFNGTVTWTITSGALPTGLSGCNGVTGPTCSISGTPSTATGSPFSFTVHATDGSVSANMTYTITIAAAPAPPPANSTFSGSHTGRRN